MPALLEPRLLEEEHGRMLVVLRRLEGFSRRRMPPPAAERPQESTNGPVLPDLTVAEFFRRCQWE